MNNSTEFADLIIVDGIASNNIDISTDLLLPLKLTVLIAQELRVFFKQPVKTACSLIISSGHLVSSEQGGTAVTRALPGWLRNEIWNAARNMGTFHETVLDEIKS